MVKQKEMITNRAAMKRYILHMTELLRPGWECTCVSAAALDDIEALVRNRVREAVRRHPTRGKTFKDVQ